MRAGDGSGSHDSSGAASGGSTTAGAGGSAGAGASAAASRARGADGGAGGGAPASILRKPGAAGAQHRPGLVSGATTMPTGFVVHDFAEYLRGVWKRNLEWRHFGGSYEHVRTSSTVVAVRAAVSV